MILENLKEPTDGGLPSAPCSASYYGAKVAFEIPKSCEVKSPEVWRETEIPDKLVDDLFALFPGQTEFLTEDICNPHLLIVDLREPLTAELVATMQARINAVLQNDQREGRAGSGASPKPQTL